MLKLIVMYLLFLLFSCGTMQPFVPGKPLKSGEYETRIGLSFSTSKFSAISLQAGIYWGVSNQDVLGLSFNNFILPSHISYARYLKTNKENIWNGNFQFHIGNFLFNEYNPDYEIDFAVTKISSDYNHSLKIGIGYYGTPIIDFATKKNNTPSTFVPVLGYQFQSKTIQAEMDMIYGLSDYHVLLYRNRWGKTHPDSTYGISIDHDEIKDIIQFGEGYDDATWKIILRSGDSLMVMNREPYPDCLYCGRLKRNRESYLPSGEYRTMWLYSNNLNVMLLDLNMKKILENYYTGGDLEILQEKNIAQKIQDSFSSGINDINVSVGYRERKN